MGDGTRAPGPPDWLVQVCSPELRHRVRSARAAGELLEPLVVFWAVSTAGLVPEVEAELRRSTRADDELDALVRVVGLKALTDLAERLADACAGAAAGVDSFD